MKPEEPHGVALVLALFGIVGCQDVQPGSTPSATLAQTEMDATAETDTENEMSLDLRLEALQQTRPDVLLQARNPFGFGAATAGGEYEIVPPPLPELPEARPLIPVRTPSVPLRMIGLVEADLAASRIAVLTDGDVVMHGQVGDVVDGRYRIVDIASTSVEVESIEDGSRRVLRLAGS